MRDIVERLNAFIDKAGDGFAVVSGDFLREVAGELQRPITVRKPPPLLNVERDAAIAQFCRDGVSRQELARRYGLCEGRIRQIERKAGVNLVDHRTQFWRQRNVEIMDLLGQGVTQAEVGRRFGICGGRVGQIRARAERRARRGESP